MVSGRHKSRTFKRIFKVTPGGKNILHYVLRKPSRAKCSKCGAILPGITNGRPTKMQNIPKSQKTVSRPYGGNLCSKCMRQTIKEKNLAE
jgi:large subunit ribosomal protein L34e